MRRSPRYRCCRLSGPRGARLLLKGVAHVLAGVLRLLADLPGGAADALALALGLQVRVTGGPADVLLGVALAHLEPVPHLVHETHVCLLAVEVAFTPPIRGL